MVVLKKLKSSSLNEVLVATVIIVIVFGIAMGILSNILGALNKKENYEQNTKLNELIYKYNNNILKIPFTADDGKFSYSVSKDKSQDFNWLSFEVILKKNNKKLVRKIIVNEED